MMEENKNTGGQIEKPPGAGEQPQNLGESSGRAAPGPGATALGQDGITVPADGDPEFTAAGPGVDEKVDEDKDRGLFDLIYGVLFDPVKTFREVALSPPLGRAALIFAVVNILGAVMGYYTSSRVLLGEMDGITALGAQIVEALFPLFVLGGLFFQFVKWAVFSGLLHLAAELYGGRGRVLGVLAVTGLAALPSILLLPIDLLLLITGWEGAAAAWLTILPGIASYVWGVALVVVGLREVHKFSTWRSVAAVLTPGVVMVILLILLVVGMAGMFASMAPVLENYIY